MSDLSALGDYTSPSAERWAAAAAAYVGMLVLAALLERLQFKLRATESKRWWASNGRDVINVCALLGVTAALRVLGLSLPIAFCTGAVVIIVLSMVQTTLQKHPRAGLWSMAAALSLGVPVLLFPGRTQALFVAVLNWLF